ncbi:MULTISPECIES: metallophosphoesterase [unclassified Rhizobium]|uniref:metallophosphoesterase n=1 Tax=unclassified Rhizobium TaxID=2613769 RepID=UPI0006F6FE6D|nr:MULTISPECIES: metallophosphoesterase [unclassified Rhizobium]KQV43566.1 phosphatase [Rhizobium sp. Root1212]KRD37751.1 phosphatase [Rhizobium sp. Root268]
MSYPVPLLRFGVIADPQYADLAPDPALNRYFRESLGRLAEAIEVFNGEELDFVVTLGDIIDRGFESFDDILPLYERSRHPAYFLLGNHDFAVSAGHLPDVARRVGLERTYYDLVFGQYRLVFLDGSDVSTFSAPLDDPRTALAKERLSALKAAGADNAQSWNGSLGEDQLSWLTAILAQADVKGEQVIVFNHYPVFPPNRHNMWDSECILEALSTSESFTAYFCGHNHDGDFGLFRGRPFITLKGMVDTPDDNAFSIVSIFTDRIEITGFGREESRVIALTETFSPLVPSR